VAELKFGRDYGIKLDQPLWFKIVSHIPLVNMLVSDKVKVDVTLFSHGGPTIGLFDRVRIPRNLDKHPLSICVAWPEHVTGSKKLVRIMNSHGEAMYVREYKENFSTKKCSWSDVYKLTRIDSTNPKE
jgi:hypothetical protein